MRGRRLPPAYPELAAEIARTGRQLKDIADTVGIRRETLSKIIGGHMRPSLALQQRIADTLRIDDVAFLFQLSREIDDPETLRRIYTLTTPHK